MSFQIDLTSDEAFKLEVLQVPGTLQVVEVYQGWCGPCKAVQSVLKRLYFDLGDRPLKFYTANADKVGATKEFLGQCQPAFLLYKDGKLVEKVVGVNAPVLSRLVMTLSDPNALAA